MSKSAATALAHAMASTKNIRKPDPLKQPAAVAGLAEELFTKVQRSQGQAFISDGWSGANDKAAFLEWVQDRLDWNNEASRQIRAFLKKHKRS